MRRIAHLVNGAGFPQILQGIDPSPRALLGLVTAGNVEWAEVFMTRCYLFGCATFKWLRGQTIYKASPAYLELITRWLLVHRALVTRAYAALFGALAVFARTDRNHPGPATHLASGELNRRQWLEVRRLENPVMVSLVVVVCFSHSDTLVRGRSTESSVVLSSQTKTPFLRLATSLVL